MLQFSDSTMQLDLTKVHNDMLFSLRIYLSVFDRISALHAKRLQESKKPVTGKVIPAGPWAALDYE